MELTMIWEVIQRRKWIILQALFIIFFVAFIGSYFVTPTYQTASKILIKCADKKDIDTEDIGISGLSSLISTTPDIDINRVLATSKPIMDKMITKIQLRDQKGDLIEAKNLIQSGLVYNLKSKIFPSPHMTISQYQATDILQITAFSPNPEEAMMMANTLAETMVNENQIQMRAEYTSARIFITDQISQVKERYNVALHKLMDFRKKEKTLDLEMETKLATEKMAELMKQKEDNIIDLAEANAKLNRLKEQLALQGSESLSTSTLKENPHIEILKRRITDLKLQLSEATAELTEKHPRVISLKEQLETVEAELVREIAIYQSSAPELVSLERQIAALEAHLEGVNKDIEKYFGTLGRLPEKTFNQANLNMELQVSQQVYGNLLDALYQVSIAEATTFSEIRVVDPALIPNRPVSPNPLVNGLMGLFVGLVFGLGLAFLMEYLDHTIRTTEDVKALKPVGLIGAVPKIPKKKTTLISSYDHNDPFFECYRTIRTYLKFLDGPPLKSLLITCAGPGEGKSTTAINLGISIAYEEKRVVLVDMDLRRPRIHSYLGLSNETGVTNILQGEASIDEAIQKPRIHGLNVITSGRPPSDPGLLIESDRTGELIEILQNRFDLVIIDSAPLLVKNDALVLSKYSEGLIIVLESGKTTRRAITMMMEILAKAHIEPVGFVLNKLPIEKGRYYYHHYS